MVFETFRRLSWPGLPFAIVNPCVIKNASNASMLRVGGFHLLTTSSWNYAAASVYQEGSGRDVP